MFMLDLAVKGHDAIGASARSDPSGLTFAAWIGGAGARNGGGPAAELAFYLAPLRRYHGVHRQDAGNDSARRATISAICSR